MSASHVHDRADWHLDQDFPDDLPARAATTHIGMFLGWVVARGLESDAWRAEAAQEIARVREGTAQGSALLALADDALSDDLLGAEAAAFARDYYAQQYLDDYVDLSDDALPTIYHEPDTAAKQEQVSEILDARLAVWRSRGGRG